MSGLRISAVATSFIRKPYFFSNLGLVDRHSVNLQSIRTFAVTRASNMKFVQFKYHDKPDEIRVGYIEGGNVVDINKTNPSLPSTMLGILERGCLNDVLCLKNCGDLKSTPMSNVCLMAPITGMDKVLCVALNYADHCREQNLAEPKEPVIFSKFGSTVIGPNEAVKLRTNVTQKVDWEVELALIIGKTCTNVLAAEAYNYVFGYTIAQDISSRDWQKDKNGGQFLLGKAQDTFCPIGPCIVTADEICDPQNLDIKCSISGEEMQKSNTCNLIHRIPDVIQRLASVMTLLPGDILLTGTPGGVGVHRKPPRFLKPGDVIHSEIQDIGAFEVKVVKF